METTRQKKVNRLIQKELSEILLKELRGAYPNVLISISAVRITPDLSFAKIYVSLLLTGDKNTFLTVLRSDTKKIRGFLGKRIGKQMRIVPDIEFYIDDTLDYAKNMDELLSNLDIPPEEDK